MKRTHAARAPWTRCVPGVVTPFFLVALASAGTFVRFEDARLMSHDPFDSFGSSSAITEDWIFVTAPTDDTAAPDGGAVYVFRREATGWVEHAVLTASDAQASDRLGSGVAVDGDTLVVGAGRGDGAVADSGATYVFVRAGSTWAEQAKLVAQDGDLQDLFGGGRISGDTVVVGAPFDDDAGMNSGSAYVFVRSGSTWSQQAKLVAGDAAASAQFGNPVSISGDRILVGAPGVQELDGSSGRLYVFERSGTVWTEAAVISSTTATGGSLATAVIEGDTILAGAWSSNPAGGGLALVYERMGTSWIETAQLTASDGERFDDFGVGVALHGDTAVVLAQYTDGVGAAYVYARSGTVWTEDVKLVEGGRPVETRFGTSAAISDEAVVYCSKPQAGSFFGAGVAFVYDLVPSQTFCDVTDGALASCPCANPGGPESGCDLAQATGGVEVNVLAQRASPARATLQGSGYPANGTPASIVVRATGLDPSSPVVFGDGLRCVGTPLVRLGAAFAIGGVSTHAFGHGAPAGTYAYQLWFRNAPSGYCDPAAAFNLSNGRTLTW